MSNLKTESTHRNVKSLLCIHVVQTCLAWTVSVLITGAQTLYVSMPIPNFFYFCSNSSILSPVEDTCVTQIPNLPIAMSICVHMAHSCLGRTLHLSITISKIQFMQHVAHTQLVQPLNLSMPTNPAPIARRGWARLALIVKKWKQRCHLKKRRWQPGIHMFLVGSRGFQN